MTNDEIVLGLPDYQITGIERVRGKVRISALYQGPRFCPHCGGVRVRSKGRYRRRCAMKTGACATVVLQVEAWKWKCLTCGRQFRQRLPGILVDQRASEAFRKAIFTQHLDGINRSRLGRREGIGAATVERYFRHGFQRQFSERHMRRCPPILGIDEHFFTRKKGFATTLCDLRRHTIYDVVLGRSEASLEAYFQRLQGKDAGRVVCMDLSSTYRALVQQVLPPRPDRGRSLPRHPSHQPSFPGLLAGDRSGRQQEPRFALADAPPPPQPQAGAEDQARRLSGCPSRPSELSTRFKQHLCYLLLKKHRTRQQCAKLIPRLLVALDHLRQAGLAQMVQLGETLNSWKEEIATMWRFTRNNGITEGFHNKMETITRQAYGFRNFENYRLRVKVLCS